MGTAGSTARTFTYGYVRVSSADQNPARQHEALGDVDRIFEDRVSGKSADRPQLEAMLAPGVLREGDTLRVASMDRLARNLDDLRRIVKVLTERGVRVEFLKEGQTFAGDESPIANLLLSLLGAVAEFERSLIAERRDEGIKIAKSKGVYKGRKPALTPEQIATARRWVGEGKSRAQIARDLKVGRSSLYRALNGEGTYALPAA
jgi:DNA invertase Pin-like site-specific DNA recombinase